MNSLSETNRNPDLADPLKVLVVDTNPRNVQEIGAALRRSGCVTLEATTFQDAKRLWIAEQPGMLIADIRLGEFNGLQLLLRARTDRPDVTAIMTCCFADKVLEAETRRFGGRFLIKPIRPEDILALALGESRRPDARTPGHMGAEVPANQVPSERRLGDRRQTMTEGFSPNRRSGDRRTFVRFR